MLLLDRLPDVHQALLDAGGVVDGDPSVPDARVGMAIRRSTLERAMWEFTSREPGVRRVIGHVDRLVVDGARVIGAVVDGRLLPADLVVDTSGRAGKLTLAVRHVAR